MLRPGDLVDIIAPSSQKNPALPERAVTFLGNWGLRARMPEDLFGNDPFYANVQSKRESFLYEALNAPDSKAVWCLRGGSGATRLLPFLKNQSLISQKIFIGFSDITALHLFLTQEWGWQTIHGPTLGQLADNMLDEISVTALKAFLFSDEPSTRIDALTPLNKAAHKAPTLEGPLTGGNFSLVQTSLATFWHIQTKGKIIFVEDVDEKPYRTLERLEHLRQAGCFDHALALILCDFTYNNPVEEREIILYPTAFSIFAKTVTCPVYRMTQVGHGRNNLPLVIGGRAKIAQL